MTIQEPSSDRPSQRMLSVIIPAMNEGGTLCSVLSQFAEDLRKEQIPFEIVVINDIPSNGTADDSSQILKGLVRDYPEIHAYDRTGGTGYGTAVSTAVTLSKGDYVVISSADACNISQDIILYYRTLDEGNDAVFGSRFIPGASVTGYPQFKLFVNRVSNFILQVLFGFKFNDYTDGFKGYRRELLTQFGPLFSTKFNITIELSLKAMLLTKKIKQVPTQWYGRSWGVSKLSILRVLRYYLSTLLYILGLRIMTEDFLKCARTKVELREINARSMQLEPV